GPGKGGRVGQAHGRPGRQGPGRQGRQPAVTCFRRAGSVSDRSVRNLRSLTLPAASFAGIPPTFRIRLSHPMIEVRDLTKRFPLAGGGDLLAVDRVSFAVRPGEVYGLLGPNGAGKTTTIRMILGLLRPTSGEATIGGVSSATHPPEVKRRVGVGPADARSDQRPRG